MKKIILTILILSGILILSAAEGFAIVKDSIYMTVSTSAWDTVNLHATYSSQYKYVQVWNVSGGTATVAFQNASGSRDTLGNIPILNNGMQGFPNETSSKMFIRGTVAGTVKIIIFYQSGDIPYPVAYSSTGELLFRIPGDSLYTMRNNPTVTYDSLVTGSDTTITFTPNKNVRHVEVMMIDTGATITDSAGIAFTLNGRTVLLGAVASENGIQSLTMSNNNTGRLYLIYLPSSAGGTITLFLKNVIFTAAKRTQIIIIQQ